MSLDISILDENGAPKGDVPLGVDEHWAILQEAKRLGLPLWNRMSEYYEDADYAREEVSPLADETALLRNSCKETTLGAKLEEIQKLLRAAIDGHNKVSAIAD